MSERVRHVYAARDMREYVMSVLQVLQVYKWEAWGRGMGAGGYMKC